MNRFNYFTASLSLGRIVLDPKDALLITLTLLYRMSLAFSVSEKHRLNAPIRFTEFMSSKFI